MITLQKLISSSKITTSSKLIYRNFTTQLTNSSSSISKSPIQKPFTQNLKPFSNSNGLLYPFQKCITHFAITSRSAAPLFPAAMKSFHRGYSAGSSARPSARPRKSRAEWKKYYFRKLKRQKSWFGLLKKKSSCRVLLKSRFLQSFHSSMLEKDLERSNKFRHKKVCLGSSFADRSRMKRLFYQSVILNLLSKKEGNLPTGTRSSTFTSSRYSQLMYCCAPSYQFSMKQKARSKKKKLKKIELPTHYLEVNYRTLKAVVFYGPHIKHIPGVSKVISDNR